MKIPLAFLAAALVVGLAPEAGDAAAAAAADRQPALLLRRALQQGGGEVGCPADGYESLLIRVKFDSYPRDFRVDLRDDATQEPVWERGDPTHLFNNTFRQSYAALRACVPTAGECWRLAVYDARGDGLTYNANDDDAGGGFRILLNNRTIDYYTGRYNGCFSTKWYRFGSACEDEQAQMGYVQYGYELEPECDTFVWDFSPGGILPYADLTEPLPTTTNSDPTPVASPAPTPLPTRLPTRVPAAPAPPAPAPTPLPLPTQPPLPPPVLAPATPAPTKLPTRKPAFGPEGEPPSVSPFTFNLYYLPGGGGPWSLSYRLVDKLTNETLWDAAHTFQSGPASITQTSTLDASSSCYTFSVTGAAPGDTVMLGGSYSLTLDGRGVGRHGSPDGGCFRKKWYTFGGACPGPDDVTTGTVPAPDGECGY